MEQETVSRLMKAEMEAKARVDDAKKGEGKRTTRRQRVPRALAPAPAPAWLASS